MSSGEMKLSFMGFFLVVEQNIKQHMGPGYGEPVHLKEDPASGTHQEGIQHLKVHIFFSSFE